MISARGQVIKWILQHRHFFKGQWKKPQVDWSQLESIRAFRREVEESAARFGKVPKGIEIIPENMDGVSAEWIVNGVSRRDQVILYFHGGGYVSGSSRSHRSVTAKFVAGSQTNALLFDYRLAPEHPYPAGLEDAVTVYRRLLVQGFQPENIVFAGDSGGGGLLLGTLLALRDRHVALPASAVALSPVTDLGCTGESHRTKVNVCLSPPGMAQAIAKHYAGDNGSKIPYASPLGAELCGLPPLLIYAGEDEILRDDASAFVQKAKAAGVDATLRIGEGMFHCYPAVAPLFPEAAQAMQEICGFIQKSLAR